LIDLASHCDAPFRIACSNGFGIGSANVQNRCHRKRH
jgi:hypothetical protein